MKRLYRLWSWLTSPQTTSAEREPYERMLLMLFTVMEGMALTSTLLVFIGWRLGTHPLLSVCALLTADLVFALGWCLARRGHLEASKMLAIASVYAIAVFGVSVQSVNSPLVLVFGTAILLSGMIYGIKTQWGMVLLSILSFLGIGWLRGEPLAPFLRAAIHVSIAFVAIGLYQWFFIGQLQHSLSQTRGLNEDLDRKSLQQERLLEIARFLAADLDLSQVFDRIAQSARELLNAHGCTIYLLDENQTTLSPIAAYDPPYEQEILATSVPVDASLTGRAIKARRALIFNEPLSEQSAFQVPGTPLDSDERLILCPLMMHDQVIGALRINRLGKPFEQQDLALAETFATYASIALKNAQAYEQLRREIEERQRSEEALRLSEERYRTLVENQGEGLGIVDNEDVFTFANPAAEAIFGVARGTLVGRSLKEFIAPEQFEQVLAQTALRRAGEKSTYELEIIRPDATRRVLLVTATPQYDAEGNYAGVFGIFRDITERRRVERHLFESEHRLRSLLENVRLLAVMLDDQGNVTFCNDYLLELTGWRHEEVIGSNWFDHFVPPQQFSLQMFKEFIAQGSIPPHYENEIFTRSGKRRCIAWSNTMLRNPESGAIVGTASIGEDITERKRAEQALQLHAQVFESAAESILITDAQGIILAANHAFSQIFGYSQDEVVGKEVRLLECEKHDWEFYQRIREVMQKEEKWRGELWLQGKDGVQTPTLTSINAVRDEKGEITHFIILSNDITLLKAAEEHLRHIATHDPLTDLPNRSLFYDRLNHALSRAKRNGSQIAVLYLDLDEFKEINDQYGHEMGDRLLNAVAQRLRNSLRESDTVARLSGDEFAILLEEVSGAESAAQVAQTILGAIAQPYAINGHKLTISASIGISLCPLNCESASGLIRRADAAMYLAKQAGKNTYRFCTGDKARDILMI